jgi:glycerol uptake facilitator-like aquaporin
MSKKQQAFLDSYNTLKQRIELLIALPIETLDRISLHQQLKAIGQQSMDAVRKLAAKAIGAVSLVAIVVASGIMGERLANGNAAIALLANALATGAGLYVLISMFAPFSGAHFNPIVSFLALKDRAINAPACIRYITSQLIAAINRVLIAHGKFNESLLQIGTHPRTGFSRWLFVDSR